MIWIYLVTGGALEKIVRNKLTILVSKKELFLVWRLYPVLRGMSGPFPRVGEVDYSETE